MSENKQQRDMMEEAIKYEDILEEIEDDKQRESETVRVIAIALIAIGQRLDRLIETLENRP